MARTRRFAPAGVTLHVVNRGNDRQVIFSKDSDYERFCTLLRDGTRKFPVELFGFCLMPNHFHLAIKPRTDEAISAYMQWVSCRYACDLRVNTNTLGHGHVFQRRFWSAPIDDQHHFLTVLRYIEANPVRAKLVSRAEDWLWGSLCERRNQGRGLLADLPLQLPDIWGRLVNMAQEPELISKIRKEIASARKRRRSN